MEGRAVGQGMGTGRATAAPQGTAGACPGRPAGQAASGRVGVSALWLSSCQRGHSQLHWRLRPPQTQTAGGPGRALRSPQARVRLLSLRETSARCTSSLRSTLIFLPCCLSFPLIIFRSPMHFPLIFCFIVVNLIVSTKSTKCSF